MHVLQEYCQPGRPFEPVPNFREEIVLVRKLPEWLAGLSKVGKELYIWRGHDGRAASEQNAASVQWLRQYGNGWNLGVDRSALIQLYETRLQQRDELVSELRSGVKFLKP